MFSRKFKINLEQYKEIQKEKGKKTFFLWEVAKDLEIDRAILGKIIQGKPVGKRIARRIARKYPQIVEEWKKEEEI